MEEFFNISLATLINVFGFLNNSSEMKEFFDGFGNILNSSIALFYFFIILSFGAYYHV